MELKLETEKLRRMVRSSLLTKGDKPLIEKVNVYTSKDGLLFDDLQLGAIGIILLYKSDSFMTYIPNGEEVFVLDKDIHKILKDSFKATTIEIKTDATKMYFKADKEKWSHDLLGILSLEDAPKIEVINTETGLLPKKLDQETIRTHFKLQVNELQDLPDSAQYFFEAEGTNLSVTVTDNGVYTREIRVTGNSDPMRIQINGDFLKAVVQNLAGEVNFLIQSTDGKEGDVLFLSCADRTSKTTYMVTA